MNARTIVITLLAAASILAAAIWAFSPSAPPTPIPPPAIVSNDKPSFDRTRTKSHRADDPPPRHEAESPARAVTAGRDDAPVPTPDAGTTSTDEIEQAQVETEPEWDDPTNQRVLGPKVWVAPVDDAEALRIDQVFKDARAARFDPRLPNQSRSASILAVKEVVDRCFDALVDRVPGASGRLIVAWMAGATGGQGRVTNPRIKVNYKLDDPAFESCVIDGAAGRTFRGPDGDPIEVEAPFFYDGAF